MAIDFQQVRQQIKTLGEDARLRAARLVELRERAGALLAQHADNAGFLEQRAVRIMRLYDPNLRCALPARQNPESLNAHFPPPVLPGEVTLLAADGSQIAPDRNVEVNYGLINVGAIQMRLHTPHAPQVSIQSRLLYDELIQGPGGGLMAEDRLALERDLSERTRLAELAEQAPPPVVSLTDGPLELWGAKETQDGEFLNSLEQYQAALLRLCQIGATTAGYVDKPAANLLVRLLEIASLSEEELPEVKKSYPLKGVTDRYLFNQLLAPGERSAVFAMQSRSAQRYQDELALHFFYLNVGRQQHPWVARVEIPAWVTQDCTLLDGLHAVLMAQSRALGAHPYPYILHRAHEAAVVTFEEKAEVTQMIVLELRKRGVEVDEGSQKQANKDISGGRTSY